MQTPLLVSIIINNYNYSHFLGGAIDSACAQTYHPVEIVVVDDGSTDDSHSIMAGYGTQILPVFKENGGQASAFNAGFVRCHGEVVIFLDADDVLMPDIAERVAAIFKAQPEVAKVQYRLEVIDACGKSTGSAIPAWRKPMPKGDLRAQVLAFPDDIPWQPTSGNAFAATVLRKIFPVPEEIYHICADYYLSNLPPLFGPIISIEDVGGRYRVHGANNHHTSDLNLEQTRQIIVRTSYTHRYIKTFSDSLGLTGFPANVTNIPSVTFLAHRTVSLKIDRSRHPIKEDRLLRLVMEGVKAAFSRFDRSWKMRCLYALWFIAAWIAPKSVIRSLARQMFHQ